MNILSTPPLRLRHLPPEGGGNNLAREGNKYIKILLIFLLLFIAPFSFAQSKTLNVYTWADFLPLYIIQKFEKETGITVYVTEYENNKHYIQN